MSSTFPEHTTLAMEWLPEAPEPHSEDSATNGNIYSTKHGSEVVNGQVVGEEQKLQPIESGESDADRPEFAKWEGQDLSAQYWGSTRDITEDALVSLVSNCMASRSGDAGVESWSLLSRQHGVYNSVYIVKSQSNRKVCVRVPACGFSERWNRYDSELLRSTALAMKMLERRTCVPLPRLLAYDCSLENDISAPYILMDCIDGINARQVWNLEKGSITKEARRQNILRSIAEAIAGLRNLKYTSSGSLWFDEKSEEVPDIGDTWALRTEGYVIKRDFETIESYQSTRKKVTEDLLAMLESVDYPDSCRDYSTDGVFALYQLITEAFLKATEVPCSDESFVLFHTDFDIQNMLVDEHGNLTGILDWDGLCTQPRQSGWSMVPFWLQNDWSPGYQWPPSIGADYAMVRPEEYERYRQDYARYLWDACGGIGDCRFTAKSHIYRAFLSSLADAYAARRFVENVLSEILPRMRASTYCSQLGQHGFRAGEEKWLADRLHAFFKPEPPKHASKSPGISFSILALLLAIGVSAPFLFLQI